jgi:hypothetical protein
MGTVCGQLVYLCSTSNSGDILLAEKELAVSVRDRSWLARFKINATNGHNLLVFHHPGVANLASMVRLRVGELDHDVRRTK